MVNSVTYLASIVLNGTIVPQTSIERSHVYCDVALNNVANRKNIEGNSYRYIIQNSPLQTHVFELCITILYLYLFIII